MAHAGHWQCPTQRKEIEKMNKKHKIKWSFLVETNSEDMQALDNDMLSEDGMLWKIPHNSVIGILKVEKN